jgi:HSP20 family protein
MYLTTLDPFTRDFDRVVRRAFGPGSIGAGYAPALPMDSVRRDGELVLRFDVREETATEGENPIVRERRFGSFTRRVRLSDNLNADAIEASNSEGVLEIRIPVLEEAKPRKISVAATEAKELAN